MYGLLIRSPRKRDKGGMKPHSSSIFLPCVLSLSLIPGQTDADRLTDKAGKQTTGRVGMPVMPPTSDSPFDKGSDADTCGDEQACSSYAWTHSCVRGCDMWHMFSMHVTSSLVDRRTDVWQIAALAACWSLFTFAKLHRPTEPNCLIFFLPDS